MNKRFFAALISVLMACLALPFGVSAAESLPLILTSTGELKIGDDGEPITKATITGDLGTYGKYNYEDCGDYGRLTLENVEYTSTIQDAFYIGAHIKPLEIVLVGSNSFTSSNNNSYGDTSGILGGIGNVTITGNGSLTATAGASTSGYSYGISCQDLTVNGGTVYATGGTVNGTGNYSMGLNATGATEIYGGTLIATGGNSSAASAVSSGIYGGDLYIEDGIVNATGGQADFSYGISPDGGGDVIMNGGTLLAQGGTAAESAGIYGADEITIGANIVSAIMQGHTAAVGAYQSMTSATEIIYTDDNDYDGGNKVSVSNLDNFDSALYIECIGTPIIIGGNETAAEEPKPEPENKPYYSNTPPPSPPTASLALIEYIDNEKVGEISLHLTSNMQKFSSYVRINSNRTAQTEEYIKSNWNVTALGSFETAQRGGWGDIATLSVSLEDLGFEVSNGTKLYVLIFDTKNKIWHEVEAIIENGEVVIVTEYSGIFGIVNEKVI
jgi:hypothetical protein